MTTTSKISLSILLSLGMGTGLMACKPNVETPNAPEKQDAKPDGQANLAKPLESDVLAPDVKTGNVLLDKFDGPYGGVMPFGKYNIDDFPPALDKAFSMARADITRIADNPAPANFDNTIEALEKSGAALNRVATLFFIHDSNLNTDKIAAMTKKYAPEFSKFSDEINQNPKLFARIQSVHDHMNKLDTEQKRLVDVYYARFIKQGAGLNDQDKATLSNINARLATLTNQFGQNVLHDEGAYVTYISDKKDLAGLPNWLIDAMAASAAEKGHEGQWAVTNTRSSMDPFLTYSDNRPLREKVWKTYYNRGDNGDKWDNNKIITEILQLRDQKAKLLGFKTHAHWKLTDQMAKTPENAMALMMKVWPYAVKRANEEVAEMQAIADKDGAGIKIAPWDYRYYAEKVRQAKYDLDFNEVKPYLQLDKLREAMMWSAGKLYGLHFKKMDDVPVFQDDVSVYDVTDDKGQHVALWYFDPYARVGKNSGAWMNDHRAQSRMDGKFVPTIVSNNSNFIKGKPGEPVLISWDDAETMFHEFGHALHGINSNVTYPSLSGTNVPRDYVEFPSQVNEHWLTSPEVMQQFLVHYKTGEPIPKALVDKIKNAATFRQGFDTVEFLSDAILDMKIHMAGGDPIDPDKFEREESKKLGMPSEIVLRHRLPQFNHIFAGGYDAGYYSYLWTEALADDAAEAFEEVGSFYDPALAKRLLECVESVGNTMDQAESYRCFRGRDVDTMALMRAKGFAPARTDLPPYKLLPSKN